MILVGALALAGCGSSTSSTSSTGASTASTSSSSASTPATTAPGPSPTKSGAAGAGGVQTLTLAANSGGELKYDKRLLTANAGKVAIDFTNMSPLDHNVTLEDSEQHLVGNTPTFQGGSRVLTLDLKPGVYKFFCSVPGHRMAGMEGELVVK
jgi:plastocyanin